MSNTKFKPFPREYVMSSEVTNAWVEAYLVQGANMDVDSHQAFADGLGISRHEAKCLCYQYMHTQPFLRNIHYAAKESAYYRMHLQMKEMSIEKARTWALSIRDHMEIKCKELVGILYAKNDTSKL